MIERLAGRKRSIRAPSEQNEIAEGYCRYQIMTSTLSGDHYVAAKNVPGDDLVMTVRMIVVHCHRIVYLLDSLSERRRVDSVSGHLHHAVIVSSCNTTDQTLRSNLMRVVSHLHNLK